MLNYRVANIMYICKCSLNTPASPAKFRLPREWVDVGELEASTTKCSGVEAALSQQQQLVARLEEDLLAAEQRHSNPGEATADAFDGLGSAGPSGLLDDGALCAETHDITPCWLTFVSKTSPLCRTQAVPMCKKFKHSAASVSKIFGTIPWAARSACLTALLASNITITLQSEGSNSLAAAAVLGADQAQFSS